jgi:Bacterial protein of unknown function (Gcw_chp)
VNYSPNGELSAGFWHADCSFELDPDRATMAHDGRIQQPKPNNNKMQNYCKNIGALAAASALVAGTASAGTPAAPAPAPAPAAESSVAYDLHVGYTSEYLFRGLNLGQDLVEAGVNVKTEYNGIGLSAGAWYGSYDNSNGPYSEVDVDELDIYAEVSKDFGFATAAVGYIYYMNEDAYSKNGVGDWWGTSDAQEVYFSLSRDLGFAKASLTYFWDIELDNDGYTELALTRAFALNNCLTLNVGTNVGYLWEQGQATAWTTKVGLDWAFVEKAKLTPFVALSVALSDDWDTSYDGSKNEFVAGSMLSVSF